MALGKVNIPIPYNLAIPLMGRCSAKTDAYVHQEICTRMFCFCGFNMAARASSVSSSRDNIPKRKEGGQRFVLDGFPHFLGRKIFPRSPPADCPLDSHWLEPGHMQTHETNSTNAMGFLCLS